MSDAFAGVGTKFFRWNSSTHAWVAIAEIKSVSGPGMTRDIIDVTSLDSTDGYREFIAGFRNAGTVGLAMNFTRAGLDMMKTDFESDDLQNYEIVLPDAGSTSLEFQGLVTELPIDIPTDDVVSMNTTIQISGAVTVNSGSGSAT